MSHWVVIGRGFALVLMAFGGCIVVLNWVMVIETRRTGRFHSAIPLFGAVFLASGLVLLPQTRHYAWIPFLADYGTLVLLYALPTMLREQWDTSRHNLLAEYHGGQGIMMARISLYRRNIFVIKHDLKRAPGEIGIVSSGNIGTWKQEGQHLTLQVGERSAEFEVMLNGSREILRQVSGFSWETNSEFALEGVDLVKVM